MKLNDQPSRWHASGNARKVGDAASAYPGKSADFDHAEKFRGLIFLASAVLTALSAFLLDSGFAGIEAGDLAPKLLYAAAYALAGWKVIAGAARNTLAGRPFDELFLMSISTAGAFLIGHIEEAVGVMVFYRIGETIQESATLRSRRSIRAVLALRPEAARVLRDGAETTLHPDEVRVGEYVRIRPGERVPLDGVVVSGNGLLDSSALTGESTPRRAAPGVEILAGTLSRDGVLTMRVTRPAGRSYASRIVDLVENAAHAKARSERFITRFARWYTPAVVAAAAALAFVPPLFIPGQELSAWVYRALVMLVISCPCALVLSVPLGYAAGLGGAARRGILVKGSLAFEALAETRVVVFDKTGTLTEGEFEVRAVLPAEPSGWNRLLELAAWAEAGSNHPIAAAVRKEAGRRNIPALPHAETDTRRREIAGRGVCAERDGLRVLAGSTAFLAGEGIDLPEPTLDRSGNGGTEVHLAANGIYIGRILLGDSVKADAAGTLSDLQLQGVRRFVLLTGDSRGPA
ncbi:MAG TPA: heavy metal translocating P-type ATPase, partial [Magnetospirillaceae bacterium]|nr:heavy metal translocating P-type ATPase [Magnetospirillaceae bacterium]